MERGKRRGEKEGGEGKEKEKTKKKRKRRKENKSPVNEITSLSYDKDVLLKLLKCTCTIEDHSYRCIW